MNYFLLFYKISSEYELYSGNQEVHEKKVGVRLVYLQMKLYDVQNLLQNNRGKGWVQWHMLIIPETQENANSRPASTIQERNCIKIQKILKRTGDAAQL